MVSLQKKGVNMKILIKVLSILLLVTATASKPCLNAGEYVSSGDPLDCCSGQYTASTQKCVNADLSSFYS